jgi:signal recognition particle receptor subunit beta
VSLDNPNIVYKAYKTELDPNNKQKTLFKKNCGVARFAYNWGLATLEEDYKNEYACTVGVDFKTIPIIIANNNIKLLLWDTAGQERFRTITQMYYRGTHVIIVIYDITDRISFENIKIWLKEIEKNAPDNIIKILQHGHF